MPGRWPGRRVRTDRSAGEPILAPVSSTFSPKKAEADLEKYIEKWKGKLKGKIVLISEPFNNIVEAESKPAFRRYTDAELQEMAVAPDAGGEDEDRRRRTWMSRKMPSSACGSSPACRRRMIDEFFEKREELSNKRAQFLADEGVLAVLQDDRRARDGLVFAEAAGPHNPKSQLAPPTFVVTSEHYNRIARLLEKKTKVELAVNLKARASDAAVDAYNVIAEIPGGSARKTKS